MDKEEKLKKKHHRKHGSVLLETDDLVREKAAGFSHFLQEYAVVGLALGFIVGQQANGVVKNFVDTFVNPFVEFAFGENLSGRAAIVHHHSTPVKIPWGGFVYTLLEFFIVLIAIYAVIKIFKLDKFTKKG